MQHQVTSADGTQIAWYDYGGDSRPLVLAHATGFCGRIWEPIIEHLRHKFRCIVYDARGHGLSHSPTDERHQYDQWDWNRLAEDVHAVLDDAAVSDARIIGHSSGATTALLAEQGRPGCFSSMCLFEPVIFPHDPPIGPDPSRDLARNAKKRRQHFASAEEAFERFHADGPFAQLDEEVLRAYVRYGFSTSVDGISLRCHPEDEAMIYITASAHDAFARLNDVQPPTLICSGEHSVAFAHDDMRAFARILPSGEFQLMPKVTHFGPLERPKTFANTAVTFFEKMNRTN